MGGRLLDYAQNKVTTFQNEINMIKFRHLTLLNMLKESDTSIEYPEVNRTSLVLGEETNMSLAMFMADFSS